VLHPWLRFFGFRVQGCRAALFAGKEFPGGDRNAPSYCFTKNEQSWGAMLGDLSLHLPGYFGAAGWAMLMALSKRFSPQHDSPLYWRSMSFSKRARWTPPLFNFPLRTRKWRPGRPTRLHNVAGYAVTLRKSPGHLLKRWPAENLYFQALSPTEIQPAAFHGPAGDPLTPIPSPPKRWRG